MAITLEMNNRLLHENIAKLHKATKTEDKEKREKAIEERDNWLWSIGYKVVNVLDINGYHKTYAIHKFLFDWSIMKTREKGEEEPSWAVIELGSYYFDSEKYSAKGMTVSLQGINQE